MTTENTERRTLTRKGTHSVSKSKRPASNRPEQSKATYSHDHALNEILRAGGRITLMIDTSGNSERYTGKLVGYDAFTITIEAAHPHSENGVLMETFFKHSLQSFFPAIK